MNLLTGFSTLALAIITLLYLLEIKSTRQMSLQPMLSIRLDLSPQQTTDTPSAIKAVFVKNIGNAPASGTKVLAELLIGNSLHKGQNFQGQIGNEEREIELRNLLQGVSPVTEIIKQIHQGNKVTQNTFTVRMSYFNSYGIAFKSSHVFELDLRPEKPAWKLTAQEHRIATRLKTHCFNLIS